MNNWLNNNQWLNFRRISEQAFKQSCLLCATQIDNNMSFCQDCLGDLPLAPNPCCPQCGLKTDGQICGNCLKHKPFYDVTHALFSYRYPVDTVIQYYKYRHALQLSKTLGQLLQGKINGSDIDIMMPMPLHPIRMQERGFNQSLEVAKVFAKQCNINLDITSCNRIKNTPPQASLTPKARIKNMKDAFNCQTTFTGMHIGLVDDVMTTGASLNELAKALKRAGASKVSCFVLARVELN